MKRLLLPVIIMFSHILSAQSPERVEITGTIVVPVGFNSSGVHVYNKSSGKGSVSDSSGDFDLRVMEGDSVYFSALQFKELYVIIDAGVVEKRRLLVEVSLGMNELPEVVVRQHDLTGYLDADAKNIETVELDLPSMTAFSINDYDWEWRQDAQSGVSNAAMPSGGLQNGADPVAILKGAIGLLIPRKKPKKQPPPQRTRMGLIELEREIRSRYDNAFFEEVLAVKTQNIADFIAFLDARGVYPEILNKEREMDLIQLMVEQSVAFKDQMDE